MATPEYKAMIPSSVVPLPIEPETEKPEPASTLAKEDYSVFTVGQKRAIIAAASFASWFSPMSGSICYPALNQIAAELGVSSAKVNLTVTTYLIIQGLAPMMIAGFSDKAGRRPAYFICFSIYIVANLALALQNNYVALLILRMVQAGGSSGTVALANGLVGDCIVSSDRGQYVAFASLGSILGPTLSPVLGGLLSEYLGWHWIFWFLLILACAFFIPLALFLPETCRNIVGDGSVPPPQTSWNVDEEKLAKLRKNHRLIIPNPLATLSVVADFESLLILLAQALQISCFYAIATGAPQAFQDIYGFNEVQISLMFLPIGGGSLISAFTTGKLVDWNFRRHARRLNFPLQRNRQTDLSSFPIERARVQIALPLFALGGAAIASYGWMLYARVALPGTIVVLLLLGYCLIASNQVMNVLMVDLWPGRPATVTAAGNLTRCLLGAAASAAIGPMTQALGYGWAYTTLMLLFAATSAGPVVSMYRGIGWRQKKKEKDQRRQERKTARREAAEARKRKKGSDES